MNLNKSRDGGESMVVGLAGGIGSGKTAVTERLRELGYAVVDADEVSRDITARDAPALAAIGDEFGAGLISEEGELDRRALADIVFNDGDKLRILNAILHSYIEEEVNRRLADAGGVCIKAGKKAMVFLSAPLFFEAHYEDKCDAVCLISAPESLRISRAAARDSVDEGEIAARIGAQMSEEERIERADYIIDNSGSVAELYRKIDELLLKLPCFLSFRA